MKDEVIEIDKYLREHQLFNEVSQNPATNEIEIFIDWGDWKHDHSYTDYLMQEKGYKLTCEELTDEDGSDCYSSIHYYSKA